jgi:hypothetical protein
MRKAPEKTPPKKRQENTIFTIFVHVGYAVLIISMIGWIVYVEYILAQ